MKALPFVVIGAVTGAALAYVVFALFIATWAMAYDAWMTISVFLGASLGAGVGGIVFGLLWLRKLSPSAVTLNTLVTAAQGELGTILYCWETYRDGEERMIHYVLTIPGKPDVRFSLTREESIFPTNRDMAYALYDSVSEVKWQQPYD